MTRKKRHVDAPDDVIVGAFLRTTCAVTYIREPTVAIAEGEVLLCSAVPAEQETDEENRIQLEL